MFLNFIVSPYFIIFIFVGIGAMLGIIVYFSSYFLITKNYTNEKLSVYECGFDPFAKPDTLFDVRYYLVAILFIIFDLEISFLFPWGIVFKQLGTFGFYSVFIFLAVLAIGFIYEWLCGALDW